jgi:hypothetical protein
VSGALLPCLLYVVTVWCLGTGAKFYAVLTGKVIYCFVRQGGSMPIHGLGKEEIG